MPTYHKKRMSCDTIYHTGVWSGLTYAIQSHNYEIIKYNNQRQFKSQSNTFYIIFNHAQSHAQTNHGHNHMTVHTVNHNITPHSVRLHS